MSDKNTMLRSNADTSLRDWHKKEKTALELLQIVGDLRFDRSIELILFRRNIYDARPSEVLNIHTFGSNYSDKEIPVEITLAMAKAISANEYMPAARIDIGTLASEWLEEKDSFKNIDDLLAKNWEVLSILPTET